MSGYVRTIREHVSARDLWALAITLLVVLALNAGRENVDQIQEGRRAGTQLNCAVATAVIKAGREVIQRSSSAALPPRLEAELVRLGYPRKPQREVGAELQARAYTRSINTGIEKATGVHSARILNPDGTLNCARLRAIARVN